MFCRIMRYLLGLSSPEQSAKSVERARMLSTAKVIIEAVSAVREKILPHSSWDSDTVSAETLYETGFCGVVAMPNSHVERPFVLLLWLKKGVVPTCKVHVFSSKKKNLAVRYRDEMISGIQNAIAAYGLDCRVRAFG